MKISLPFAPISLLKAALFALGVFQISSQPPVVAGTVQDLVGGGLENVEILNLSNHFVAISDVNGRFEIRGNQKDKLRFIAHGLPVFDTVVGADANLVVTLGRLRKNELPLRPDPYASDFPVRKKTATTKTIRGRVSDLGGPLPGAYVLVKGTHYGTSTDIDGLYSIEANDGENLVFTFVGYGEKTVKVSGETIDVILDDSDVKLSEVVIEGYRAPKKSKKTMSSTVVIRGTSGVASDEAPATPPISTLSGTVAGLNITTKGDVTTAIKGYSSEGSAGTTTPKIKAGQLTSGEVNDFSKWEYWEDIASQQLKEFQKRWQMVPAMRFSVILVHADGFAVQDKTLHLMSKAGDTLWTAHTGNTGRAELWYKPEQPGTEKISEQLVIVDGSGKTIATKPKEFHDGINTFAYNDHCNVPGKVDIAFIVDATGSMGDEISYLQSELSDVIERNKKTLPDADLRVASVFYRDREDDYLVKNFDFTTKIKDVVSFVGKQSAGGGGDYPEAVVEAFEASIDQLSWSDDARTRLLFVVLDAPPHENPDNIKKLQALARRASAKGIKIVPVAASGIDKSTEYLMRAMALETNGTYLFITNHSGIGNDHIEPSTDSYAVEMLNDLLLRVISQFAATGDCQSQQLPTNAKFDAALDKKSKLSWKYFPNPTSGKVTIECGRQASGMALFDTTGKLVLRRTEPANSYTIDLAGLPNAVYYLTLMVGDEMLSGKIIKMM